MKQEITPEIIDNLKDKMCNGGEEIAKAILLLFKYYLQLFAPFLFLESYQNKILADHKRTLD